MPDLTIYLDDKTYSIKQKMPRGLISEVCQKAIQEWDNFTEDIPTLEKKLLSVQEEISKKKAEEDFLLTRIRKLKLDKMTEEERQKSLTKEEKKKNARIEREAEKMLILDNSKLYAKILLESYEVDESLAKSLGLTYAKVKKDHPQFGKWATEVMHLKKKEQKKATFKEDKPELEENSSEEDKEDREISVNEDGFMTLGGSSR